MKCARKDINRSLGLLIALCLITGLIITSLDYIAPDSLPEGIPTANTKRRPDFRLPAVFPEVPNTRQLIAVLQQKLQVLTDADLLANIGERKTCIPNDTDKKRRCIDPHCNKTMTPRFSPQNIESIRKPILEVGPAKLREVHKIFNVKPEGKKYVFLTGASSNHYMESEAAIQSLQRNVFPHLTNYSLIFYDLGLTKAQRQTLTEKFHRIPGELKLFPFDKLPASAAFLTCYTWKALIILAHLQKSDFIIWMDSSINYFGDIRSYFDKVAKTGILITKSGQNFPQHVYLGMFEYFGDQACQFSKYEEVEGNLLVFHNEPFTRHLVIEPWSACALDPSCMCPFQSRSMLFCNSKVRQYGKCHRFDQAAIGYILIKFFREHIESVFITESIKNHSVERGQRLKTKK